MALLDSVKGLVTKFLNLILSPINTLLGYIGVHIDAGEAIDKIVSTLKGVFGDVVKLFKNIVTTFTKITTVVSDVENLFDTVKGEVFAWKNFKEDIRIKSRVINLEKAIEKTRALIQGIPDSWRAVLDIISQIKKAVAKDIAAEEGAALLAVETAGLSEVATAVAIIYQIASFVTDTISDLQTIVDELKRLRLEVEKLDTVFAAR